jgi:hypothetical protein
MRRGGGGGVQRGDRTMTNIAHFSMDYSPLRVTLRCACGWSESFTRKQNALGRAAKVRAAMRKHTESHRR